MFYTVEAKNLKKERQKVVGETYPHDYDDQKTVTVKTRAASEEEAIARAKQLVKRDLYQVIHIEE